MWEEGSRDCMGPHPTKTGLTWASVGDALVGASDREGLNFPVKVEGRGDSDGRCERTCDG